MITEETRAEMRTLMARYPQPRSALLPMLHLVQSAEGLVSPAGIEACAEELDITAAEVAAVATFYTMYKRHPVGDYHVGVCTNTLCAVMGGDAILERLEEHLGIGNDETTDDGKISLEHIECNAACDYAPVMTVNWEFLDNQTPESAVQLVDDLRAGVERSATRGARLCTWRQAERVLAGFPDGRADEGPDRRSVEPGGTGAGPRTRAGPRGRHPTRRPTHRRGERSRRRPGRHSGRTRPRRTGDDAGRRRRRRRVGPPRHPLGRAGRRHGDARRQPDDLRGVLVTDTLTPVLSANWGNDRAWTIGAYRQSGGYRALPKAVAMGSAAVVDEVKNSGLRGRGGAGFPTGVKWGFLPPLGEKPRYLVVNADESEPGTCKDVPFMMADPHLLVEGVIVSSFAIQARHAFIYVRGEVLHVVRRLQQAVQEAYDAGFIGENILDSGYDLDITVHAGAGAYICGEETALLDSLEGRRGQPRLRPPFPAVAGLYASPTVINNVESIASVPGIVNNGAEWFSSMGSEKSKGHVIYSLSGHVTRPGQYEAPLGITLRELLDLAGGIRAGHELKFWTPGGSSVPFLTAEQMDVPLDFEGMQSVGSQLGTRALSCSTTPSASSAPCSAGRSSTSTSPAASAPPVARARCGSSRSSSGSRTAAARSPTSTSCSTCARTSWAGRSAVWATAPRLRSPRR